MTVYLYTSGKPFFCGLNFAFLVFRECLDTFLGIVGLLHILRMLCRSFLLGFFLFYPQTFAGAFRQFLLPLSCFYLILGVTVGEITDHLISEVKFGLQNLRYVSLGLKFDRYVVTVLFLLDLIGEPAFAPFVNVEDFAVIGFDDFLYPVDSFVDLLLGQEAVEDKDRLVHSHL